MATRPLRFASLEPTPECTQGPRFTQTRNALDERKKKKNSPSNRLNKPVGKCTQLVACYLLGSTINWVEQQTIGFTWRVHVQSNTTTQELHRETHSHTAFCRPTAKSRARSSPKGADQFEAFRTILSRDARR